MAAQTEKMHQRISWLQQKKLQFMQKMQLWQQQNAALMQEIRQENAAQNTAINQQFDNLEKNLKYPLNKTQRKWMKSSPKVCTYSKKMSVP